MDRKSRISSAIAAALLLGVGTSPAWAQHHAHGETWLHRDAGQSTMLHAHGDSLCTADFPARCWGGMMSPDSIHCRFDTVPHDSLPDSCYAGFDMEIHDPQGQSMMSGHMMRDGFFTRDIECTFHYEPGSLPPGMDPANLVLVALLEGRFVIVDSAVHDVGSSIFTLTTPRPSSWYGVFAKGQVPVPVQDAAWGMVKKTYR